MKSINKCFQSTMGDYLKGRERPAKASESARGGQADRTKKGKLRVRGKD